MEKMKEFSVAGIDQMPNTSDPDYYKIILDISGSMEIHEHIVKKCLKDYQNELLNIDEASAIFISKSVFGRSYSENPYNSVENFSTEYKAFWDSTNLYGAIVESVKSTIKAHEKLIEEAYEPRMTNIILTDGFHNQTLQYDFYDAKKSVEKAIENGIAMVFIDFGGENGRIPKELGFQTIYSCENSAEALKTVFGKITQSCIRQSQSKVVDPKNWIV